MKKIVLSIALAVLGCSAFAQNSNVVSDQYNRNGLSVILLDHNDSYDKDVLSSVFIPDKFDFNRIQTSRLYAGSSRGRGDLPSAYSTYAPSQSSVKNALDKNGIGKELLSFIFNRQADGTLSDEILRARGMYNASDADVLRARASMAGMDALENNYDKLIASTYVMVYDADYIESIRDSKGKYTYRVIANAQVYKVNFNLDEVWDAWIYEDDSAEQKAAKIKKFNNIPVEFNCVANVNVSTSSTEKMQDAIEAAYSDALDQLTKVIPQWEVRVYVYDTHPIKAKIGKKESVSNGKRFCAYSYTETRTGELKSVKHGYLRATEVADNRYVSSGNSDPSLFYQISGMQNIQPGWVLKEAKDKKLGASLGFGACEYTTVGLQIDYLLNISKRGSAAYAFAGFDFALEDRDVSYVNVGAGYQIRIIRPLMLMPYAYYREMLYGSNFTPMDSRVGAGLQANLQVIYPVQLFVKIGAELSLETASLISTLGLGARYEF